MSLNNQKDDLKNYYLSITNNNYKTVLNNISPNDMLVYELV